MQEEVNIGRPRIKHNRMKSHTYKEIKSREQPDFPMHWIINDDGTRLHVVCRVHEEVVTLCRPSEGKATRRHSLLGNDSKVYFWIRIQLVKKMKKRRRWNLWEGRYTFINISSYNSTNNCFLVGGAVERISRSLAFAVIVNWLVPSLTTRAGGWWL